MRKTILFEIGTEELPASLVKIVATTLYESLAKKFNQNEFVFESKEIFSTPRRLSAIFYNINDKTPEKEIVKKGPRKSDAFDNNGVPTKIGIGFAKSVNSSVENLITIGSESEERLAFKSRIESISLEQQAPINLESCITEIQNAKGMFWGSGLIKFIRPIRWITIIIDNRVIDGCVFNFKIGNSSRGHRVLGQDKFVIPSAAKYQDLLKKNGIIASRNLRKKMIKQQIEKIAAAEKCVPLISEPLLEEVVDLVEWPEAMIGTFSIEFLNLPREIIVATMQDHQRYFPVANQDGSLHNKFVFIANNTNKEKHHIVEGNEKVLRPRLEDAKFFYEEDIKTSIDFRLNELKSITYHKNLGTIYEKAKRIEKSTDSLCKYFKASKKITSEVAMLAYNDLTSRTVSEFPSLQGKMSAEFAAINKHQPEIIDALSTFYHPRFHDDDLPSSREGLCASYAEKLDTIVGIFALGIKPSGDKDPFGLRRSSTGLIRILVEGEVDIDLLKTINMALANFDVKVNTEELVSLIQKFILERFKSYLLEKNIDIQISKCVLSNPSYSVCNKYKQACALQNFYANKELSTIIKGQKRIKNILKKNKYKVNSEFDVNLCREHAEKNLFEKFVQTREIGKINFQNKDYAKYLSNLTQLKHEIDQFFLEVMVFDENEKIATNRVTLLYKINNFLCMLGDISELNG